MTTPTKTVKRGSPSGKGASYLVKGCVIPNVTINAAAKQVYSFACPGNVPTNASFFSPNSDITSGIVVAFSYSTADVVTVVLQNATTGNINLSGFTGSFGIFSQ